VSAGSHGTCTRSKHKLTSTHKDYGLGIGWERWLGAIAAGTSCEGEINAMVEGSKFKESHLLKILS